MWNCKGQKLSESVAKVWDRLVELGTVSHLKSIACSNWTCREVPFLLWCHKTICKSVQNTQKCLWSAAGARTEFRLVISVKRDISLSLCRSIHPILHYAPSSPLFSALWPFACLRRGRPFTIQMAYRVTVLSSMEVNLEWGIGLYYSWWSH